jgi:putative Mn2+ efflux pump MntP
VTDQLQGVRSVGHLGRLVVTGLALSLDNLVVGFALGALHVSLVAAAATIGSVSMAMSIAGLEAGRRLGMAMERHAALVAGLVLVAVGTAVAVGAI